MVKEKRKIRLDKGSLGSSSGEFLGFGGFAVAQQSVAATGATATAGATATTTTTTTISWSPVYTGSDSQLAILFKKIGQKRDGSTKAKALVEVKAFFEDETQVKKEQVTALTHLLFIYHSKLNYDEFSSVRAAALSALDAARRRLPKGWTTLLDHHKELKGMIWCAQADPSSEVKTASQQICEFISIQDWTGVWDYVTRILGYGRAKTMHQDLFARKSGDETLTDIEREHLDERYERIVGTALSGVTLWVNNFPETTLFSYDSFIKDSILWKPLTNTKNSFRLKAYQSLGAMCQHAKSVVYGTIGRNSLPKLLPTVVAQEKHPTNVPHLFEVLLLYITSGDTATLDLGQLVKPINKMLKKACFGSSPLIWGPVILPLLASIDDENLIVSVISSLLEGRDATIGLGDSLLVTSSAAESSCYFMLRSEGETPMDSAIYDSIAGFWCESLKIYLATSGVTPVSREPDKALENIIGKTLCRLDEASFDKENCVIYRIKECFWNDQLPAVMLSNNGPETNRRFKNLIRKVAENRRKWKQQSHLFPVVRQKFHDVLSRCQSHSASVPSDEDYELMQTCLEFSSSANIFGSATDHEETRMEAFLLNDLLRWVVIHTSQLRTARGHRATNKQAMHDFSLLRICLGTIPSAHKQKVLWETVLRELVASKCDIGVFARGLQELCVAQSEGEKSAMLDVIKCEGLDNLGIQVVEDALQDSMLADSPKLQDFLRTCSGLHDAVSSPLVGKRVVSKWVETIWSEQDHPVVSSILPVLLGLARDRSLLSNEETIKVVLLAWQIGGDIWVRYGSALIAKQGFEDLRDDFLGAAGSKLRASLVALCDASSELSRKDMFEQCNDWSERAIRWFRNNDEIRGFEKLDRVGLVDMEMWQTAGRSDRAISQVLVRCTSTLFSGLESDAERVSVLFAEDGNVDRISLFANMMIAASDPELRLRGGTSKELSCDSFITMFGGRRMFNDTFVHRCVEALVQTLEDSLLESSSLRWTRRSVSALSEFINAMIQPFLSNESKPGEDQIDATTVKEGDVVWYVVNPEQESIREKAEVVKVHSDDSPRLYFTIRIEKNGKTEEKQTVVERLRQAMVSTQRSIKENELTLEERSLRVKLSNLLVDKIVKPAFAAKEDQKLQQIEAAAECINMVFTQCGVFGKAGIGSLRYEMFQILSSLQDQIVQLIETKSFDSAALSLRGLSLALGFGELSYQAQLSLKYVQFDPEPSLKSLVALYDTEDPIEALHQPTLMWMSTACGSIRTDELRNNVMKVICSVVSRMTYEQNYEAVLAIRAMRNVYRYPPEQSNEWEGKAISKLVYLFANIWEVEGDNQISNGDQWWSKPLDSLIADMLRTKTTILRDACRDNALRLVGALSLKSKRWLAFRFLHMASKTNEPLHIDAAEDMLPQVTQSRLNHWKKAMIASEADELEDDLLTVFEWVPSDLMVEIESWIDDQSYFDDVNEDTTITRMLGWLTFLQYLESSAADDVRNRVAFSSYASKSGGVFFILSACVMYLSVDLDRKSQRSSVTTIDDMIVGKESINVNDLALTVLFHTVEVFPTLSRGWWEEDCPKALSATVSKFVQLMVAPETLRRELERINAAMTQSATGEMTVKGSTVSREVTATYLQDECTLSIAIQIPPNFPFRSVDVDGRKTLGVPENRFKRWALQIRQILNNQDGTLLDALMLWKRNVEKEFEGVEPCPVCYSVLAVKTHELPNLECKTCANTFHSSCLQKWFSSSGKSQCVICQQPWSGTRIN